MLNRDVLSKLNNFIDHNYAHRETQNLKDI